MYSAKHLFHADVRSFNSADGELSVSAGIVVSVIPYLSYVDSANHLAFPPFGLLSPRVESGRWEHPFPPHFAFRLALMHCGRLWLNFRQPSHRLILVANPVIALSRTCPARRDTPTQRRRLVRRPFDDILIRHVFSILCCTMHSQSTPVTSTYRNFNK